MSCVAGCVHGERHCGPHTGPGVLPRQWWSDGHTWPGHHPQGCHECGRLEDLEVERLRAGGPLRPGQQAPKWLREGRKPPGRVWRGATPPGRGGGRYRGSRVTAAERAGT